MKKEEADLATEEVVTQTVAENAEINWEEASKEDFLFYSGFPTFT